MKKLFHIYNQQKYAKMFGWRGSRNLRENLKGGTKGYFDLT
jgi:hypothetical protein